MTYYQVSSKAPLLPQIFILLFCIHSATAVFADHGLERRQFTIDGITREALLAVPTKAESVAAPVLFAFHGHGGTMEHAARSFGYHSLWPEAIVIYMQGLKTPGKLTDPEGKKTGWQSSIGDQGDRDLKFFDVVMSSLKQGYQIDEKRVYATGHSNGGGFTYLLWAARGDQFSAFAPCAAFLVKDALQLKPKPVLHLAGENDPPVKYAWQKAMIERVRKLNECGDGESWHRLKGCTVYHSRINTPVVTFIHPGSHAFPAEAPAIIVRFFKEQTRRG